MVNVGKYTIHGCYGKMNSDNTNWGILQKWLWLYCRRTYTTCSRCGGRGKKGQNLNHWIWGKRCWRKEHNTCWNWSCGGSNLSCMSQVEEVINSIQMNLACNGKTVLCNSVNVELWLLAFFTVFQYVSVFTCDPSAIHESTLLFQGMLRNVRQVSWSGRFFLKILIGDTCIRVFTMFKILRRKFWEKIFDASEVYFNCGFRVAAGEEPCFRCFWKLKWQCNIRLHGVAELSLLAFKRVVHGLNLQAFFSSYWYVVCSDNLRISEVFRLRIHQSLHHIWFSSWSCLCVGIPYVLRVLMTTYHDAMMAGWPMMGFPWETPRLGHNDSQQPAAWNSSLLWMRPRAQPKGDGNSWCRDPNCTEYHWHHFLKMCLFKDACQHTFLPSQSWFLLGKHTIHGTGIFTYLWLMFMVKCR